MAGIEPTRLRTEYTDNPLGIDNPNPRLSWQLISNEQGQKQIAYRIIVTSFDDEIWDSGRIESGQSIHITYEGQPLSSGQRCEWKVQVWDKDGNLSEWSEPAWWEMGLLSQEDWQGKWISADKPALLKDADFFKDDPAPLLRRDFIASKPIKKARAYVSGLGYYELSLNGEKVGEHVLDPGWTTYSKRILYSTYDVTELLQEGENAVGIMLGNGWYNPLPFRMWGRINLREHLTIGQPRATLQLNIEYSDGTMESIVTDESWKVDDGPIIRNSIYLGEVYDARKEQAGWDKPGFDDIGWKQAILTTEPIGPLCAQSAPPIKITHSFSPVLITKSPSDAYIVDMGENFSGWITLHAQGTTGTEIKMVYGELLNPDGTLNANTAACGQIKGDKEPQIPGAPINAYQTDVFILKGEGIETYTPRFTFHGFRYVEITGYPGDLTLDFVIGHRLNSAVEDAGSFSCSNEMFNRVQEIVRRTQLSNMFSVQSDCPHRERFGYGGDIVASSEMALLNFDMEQFYAKTTRDFADTVRTNGGITETAPFVGIDDFGLGEGSGCVEWGAAYLLLQWQLYQYYGDKDILEEQYVTGKRYIELLKSSAIDNIIKGGLCDHEGLTPKAIELTGTAYYFYCVYLMMSIAMILENASDARRYAALAEDVRKAYNARFLDAETGRYDTGTQFCQSISLFLGLVPKEQRSAALTVLIQEVEACDNHLNTGILGTKYLLDVLTNMGRPDLAYTIANQKSFPGWGYMLENGATTLWEHWEKEECTFSHNHPMFGSVSEWFYKALGGIAPHPAAKGFDKILIMPQIVGDLEWVKASYESVRGLITCEWERHGPAIKFNISIPVGATATLCLPTNIPGAVTEGRKLVSLRDGIELVRTEPGWVVYAVGSGSYTFGSVLKKV